MVKSSRTLKTPSIKPLLLAALLILAILASGCTDYVRQIQDQVNQNSDPVLRRAEPYISPIDTENATYRAMAVSIVQGGPNGDKEYQVNRIYRNIVDDYSYYSDPRTRDYIQPPFETIALRGGDCEDLSILLCSLLENVGIRTYLVLTDDHAYCLASGVDMDKLKSYAEQSLLQKMADDYNAKNGGNTMVAENGKLYTVKEEHETTTIKGGYVWYYGGNGSKLDDSIQYMNCQYEIDSTSPLMVYYVPSSSDYDAICQNQAFDYYLGSDARNVVRLSNSCQGLTTNGGLVLKNDGKDDAVVTVDIKKYTYYATDDMFKDLAFTSYMLNNQTCVVLDATAGKYGYPGFSSKNQTGDKIAIDPVTEQYYYLG